MQRAPNDFGHAQVVQVVSQMRPEQELRRQIRHGARLFLRVHRGGADPAPQQVVPHQECQRHVIVMLGRKGWKFALDIKQLLEKGPLDLLLVQRVGLAWRTRLQRLQAVQGGIVFSGHVRFLIASGPMTIGRSSRFHVGFAARYAAPGWGRRSRCASWDRPRACRPGSADRRDR